jgi:hypothetical protein
MYNEPDIDTQLAAMSQERPIPSAALISRILSDADRIQSGFALDMVSKESWTGKLKRYAHRFSQQLGLTPSFSFPAVGAMTASIALALFSIDTLDLGTYDEVDRFALSVAEYVETDFSNTESTSEDATDTIKMNVWLAGWDTSLLSNIE